MTFWTIIGILLVVLVVGLAIKALIRVVPHEERLVIYRLGHFQRVVGPGPVIVVPRLEEVKRTYRVRDQPLEVTVAGLFPYGVPDEMTLNLWCRFDLVQAAGGDREILANLVQFSDGERRQQVQVKVQEALIHQIAELQERRPLPPNASLRDRVFALAPGGPRYRELLEGVKRELEQILPSVGAVLNTDQSITLTKRNLSGDIIEALKRLRGREIDSEWLTEYAEDLRRRFPGISNAVLAQMLASVEGVDAGKVQRLLVEREEDTGAKPDVELEYEMSGDQERAKIIAKPKIPKRDASARPEPGPSETDDRTASRTPRPLTESDLALLKRVPRKDRDQRISA